MIPSHNQWPMAATQLAPTDWNYVHWWRQSVRPTKLVTYHHCLQTFRPFARTSCIGKVFHKIIAKHLERYLSPTTSLSHQFRSFISEVNGTMEHTFHLSSLLKNTRANGSNLCHLPWPKECIWIRSTCSHCGHVPSHLTTTGCDLLHMWATVFFSKVQAVVSSKNWSPNNLPIHQDIFQGAHYRGHCSG